MIKRVETNRVIFHHSLTDSGDVETFRRYHTKVNGWEDVGYHFVILPDGTVQEGRKITMVGSHAKGKNHDSIGICLIGDFRHYEPTLGQLNACVGLYHGLCRAYSKTLDIQFHRSLINPCPGPKLDRNDFREILYRANPYRRIDIFKGEK